MNLLMLRTDYFVIGSSLPKWLTDLFAVTGNEDPLMGQIWQSWRLHAAMSELHSKATGVTAFCLVRVEPIRGNHAITA